MTDAVEKRVAHELMELIPYGERYGDDGDPAWVAACYGLFEVVIKRELAALREENQKLRESNDHWRSSTIWWHRCSSGTIRHWPTFVCSMCSGGTDFDALAEFNALREERDRLREALQGMRSEIEALVEDGTLEADAVEGNAGWVKMCEALAVSKDAELDTSRPLSRQSAQGGGE